MLVLFFSEQYGYSIYKKTSSLSQLLQQAECDAIGIEVQGGTNKIYAVDVAFHEAGLNYGTREATIKKIPKIVLRKSTSPPNKPPRIIQNEKTPIVEDKLVFLEASQT